MFGSARRIVTGKEGSAHVCPHQNTRFWWRTPLHRSMWEAIVEDQRNRGLMMFLTDGLVLAHATWLKSVKQRCDAHAFKHPVTFLNGSRHASSSYYYVRRIRPSISVSWMMCWIFSPKRRVLSSWRHWESSEDIQSYIRAYAETEG